jgi:surface antigen
MDLRNLIRPGAWPLRRLNAQRLALSILGCMKHIARTRHAVAAAGIGALLLAGCQTPPSQRDTGMVIGGILGGVMGQEIGRGSGRTAATIVGTLIGAAVGGSIGRSMEKVHGTACRQADGSWRTQP